ncbi:unnamed protein product, partial [Mesorhabditis belari]|uniref:Uncharacterized protein n=1 Tax=Mesorhabditis belari TaxID=2138241 RepID=A0AAF3EF16_9BILA
MAAEVSTRRRNSAHFSRRRKEKITPAGRNGISDMKIANRVEKLGAKTVDPFDVIAAREATNGNAEDFGSKQTGVLPIKIDYGPPGSPPKNLKWIHSERELSEETIRLMLPKFALGLPLVDQPYRFVAERGFVDLLNFAKNSRPIIANLIQIVRALRAALYSFDHAKKRETLRILVKLSRIQGVGPALVPFYRQLLPPLRVVSHVSSLAGKIVSIDRDLERDIGTALNELERNGGPNAYTNIKYVLPTYESCLGV